ncbi:hypothetical protein V1477_007295 [Vespula maculifrons]|uniref:Uncharacterized protein n=1 Tax=Vespula maculifrons TaxID=7453 RepID=A0ABD2CKP8_VESMC
MPFLERHFAACDVTLDFDRLLEFCIGGTSLRVTSQRTLIDCNELYCHRAGSNEIRIESSCSNAIALELR